MWLVCSVCCWLALDVVLMCLKLLQVVLSKNQPNISSQHLRSEHISWALRWASSVLWLDLGSPNVPLITWQEGNTNLGMGCCCFHAETRCWSSLQERGKQCPLGADQQRRENGPSLPAEGHLSDSHLVMCQSPSLAEELSVTQYNSHKQSLPFDADVQPPAMHFRGNPK